MALLHGWCPVNKVQGRQADQMGWADLQNPLSTHPSSVSAFERLCVGHIASPM